MLAAGTKVEIVCNDVLAIALALVWLVGMTNAFNLLDNMDGLAATLAAIAAAFFAIDAVTVHPNRAVLVLVARAAAARAPAFLPFNLRPGRRARGLHGRLRQRRCSASRSRRSASPSSWKVAGTTVATLLLPLLVLAVPILDTTLVTVVRLLEGRPIYQGGRDHTSHRLVYHGLSERRAVVLLALIAAALGATSLAYNVLDNAARHARRASLLTFALLVQFGELPRRRRARAASRRGPSGLPEADVRRPPAAADRGASSTSPSITASFFAAYVLLVGTESGRQPAALFVASLPVVLAARYLVVHPVRPLQAASGATPARATLRAIAAAVAVSEALALGVPRRDAVAVRRLPALDLHRRRADLHGC